MNRRDLAKGLLLLPLVGSAKGGLRFLTTADNQSSKRHARAKQKAATSKDAPMGKFRVYLEGPFVLVSQQSNSGVIKIFSPMEALKKHHFRFNGAEQKHKQKHAISFLTAAGALAYNASFPPISDPLLKPFTWNSNDWDQTQTDNLLELDLPNPDSITSFVHNDKRTVVIFESDPNTSVEMPSGHVLEYTLDPQKLIEMTDSVMGAKFPEPNAHQSGIPGFELEIGLPLKQGGPDPDQDGSHATSFHNDVLLPRFPSIKMDRDKRFLLVTQPQLTTTLECKLGGFIVTTP